MARYYFVQALNGTERIQVVGWWVADRGGKHMQYIPPH